MFLTFLITILSFLITIWKAEIGLSLLFLGILFPLKAGHLTSNISIIAGTLLAGIYSFLKQRDRNLSPELKFLLPALIGFIILGLFSQHYASYIFSEDVARQSFVSFRWFIFHFLIIFAVLFNLKKIDELSRIINFYKVIYLSILILALLQSLKVLNLLDIGEYPYFINEGMGEVYGIFRGGGPNVLAAFIFMLFPLIIVSNINRNKKGTIFSLENIILTVLTLIIFLLTSSRAGYLALFLLFPLISLAIFFKRKYLKIYVFSALPLLIISYLFTFYLFRFVEPGELKAVKQDNNWECYLINENHKIKQIIYPDNIGPNSRLYLYLAGGRGRAYQLILKITGKIVKVFKDELEPTPRWYEVAIPAQIISNKKEINLSLEVQGKLDAKNNYVVVYGGRNLGQEKVTSYLYDGIKWSNQDLSLRSGVQKGIYYIFFKGNAELQKGATRRSSAGSEGWDIIINHNKYKIEQIISLNDIKESRDLYLNLAGGIGKDYRVKVWVEDTLVEEFSRLENNPKWYRVSIPEGILKGREKIRVILEGAGRLDSDKNWFLLKGGSETDPDIKSAFYDGSSWQDYDLSPEKGLQTGMYYIFLGESKGCCYGQEDRVWDCIITNNTNKIKQIIGIDQEKPADDLYLELAGGSGNDYGIKVIAEGEVIARYGPLDKVPQWYKIKLPAAIRKNKKAIEIIVEGTGKLDTKENWFIVKGELLEGAPVKGLFYDGVSWQGYDLSPNRGLQQGAYHIFLSGQDSLPKPVSPGGFSSNWDMFLADPHHKVLQKIILPKERDRKKLYLLLSGAMGNNYGFRIRVDGKIIKTFDHKISVHPQWYELEIPDELLKDKDFINVELEAFGKLDQGENWVKIYGNDSTSIENIKSFLFDGKKWIDFDLSIREGIQGGAYHIYLDSPPSVYSTYAIPIVTELFYNGNKIKQVFQIDKEDLTKYRDLIINMAGGPGKYYKAEIKANGLLVKNFPKGLPTERGWYKLPLPQNLRLKENKLEITVELIKDDKKDIVKNRVIVGAGVPYQKDDIKSYLDINGNWEEVGIPPLSNMPKDIYQIFLLDAKNNTTYPPLLPLDKLDLSFLTQKDFAEDWLVNLVRYFTERDQTSHDRLFMWALCWDIVKDHPLLGVGYYTFPIIYPQYYKKYKDFLPQIYTHPHNDYLAMAIGFGIGGMVLFALWYLLPLKTSLKLCLNLPEDPISRYGLALASIYLSLFVLSLFYMNFADERLYGIFWFIVGLTYFLDNFWVFPRS